MSLDINRLLDQLDDARDATLNLIDKFKKISDFARDFEGTIASTVPAQIQRDIEIITNLTDGKEQNSLSSLIELIENVPVGQVRTHKAIRTTLDPSATSVVGAEGINTTPNVSNGVQSAVAAENTGAPVVNESSSSALSAYLKSGRMKEQKARYIANTINLGKTLEGIEHDSPYGKSMNELVSPDLHYDLNKILENAGAGTRELANAVDTSLHTTSMAKMREQVEKMHEGEEEKAVPDWRKAAQSVHMNETLNGFDGMFGGAKRASGAENIDFDKIFEGGLDHSLGHVVETEWNDSNFHIGKKE